MYKYATGPGDTDLYSNSQSGYKPVSRIGEIVMNAVIDPRQYKQVQTSGEMCEFHKWATVLPGMVTVGKINTNERVGHDPTDETTVRCIASCNGLNAEAQDEYYFTGISRSKSVRSVEESTIGPSVDEFFTVAIGGLITVLNNGSDPIKAGSLVVWSFENENTKIKAGLARRILVKSTNDLHASNIIGRAMNYASRGQNFDLLIRQ